MTFKKKTYLVGGVGTPEVFEEPCSASDQTGATACQRMSSSPLSHSFCLKTDISIQIASLQSCQTVNHCALLTWILIWPHHSLCFLGWLYFWFVPVLYFPSTFRHMSKSSAHPVCFISCSYNIDLFLCPFSLAYESVSGSQIRSFSFRDAPWWFGP